MKIEAGKENEVLFNSNYYYRELKVFEQLLSTST